MAQLSRVAVAFPILLFRDFDYRDRLLEELIAKEKEGVSKDKDLRKKFAEIEKLLVKNVSVREFHLYLEGHEELLPSLSNIGSFKEEVWKSYLRAHIDLYVDLLEKYTTAEKRKSEIEAQAAKERTQWEDVIDTFNSRFFVPFKLVAKNQVSVIIGQRPNPQPRFYLRGRRGNGLYGASCADGSVEHRRKESVLRAQHNF